MLTFGDKNMVFCIDFDGTCVKHEYPYIGDDIGAIPVLGEIIKNGHKIILYTMRSGKELEDAKSWFDENYIPLYGVNKNPTQHEWTESPKAFGHIYIDDAALGTPLIYVENERPFVDWAKIKEILVNDNILNEEEK